MTDSFLRRASFGTCVAIGLVAGAEAGAAVVAAPYQETFDSYATGNTAVANFTETSTALYTVTEQAAGDKAYRASINATSASAAVEMSGLAGQAFSVSTDLKVVSGSPQSPGTPSANAGLGLFGATGNFSAGTEYRLLYQTVAGPTGALFLVRNTATVATSVNNATGKTLTVSPDANYVLTAEVDDTGPLRVIRGILSDGTNAIQVQYTETNMDTAPAGAFFGYRTASSVAEQVIEYDNFTVQVPEPGAVALLGLGAVALGGRRRRA